MSGQPDFDEQFTAQLKVADLFFCSVLRCAQLRAESWKAGAAIFGAGPAFSGALLALHKAFGF